MGSLPWWVYLLTMLAGFAAPLALLLCVGRTDWFLNHTSDTGLAVVGYGESLKGRNCQILIFGDSSSLTGLDPRIIEQRTGMSACNISEGTTIETVVGTDLLLSRYLAHNAPPKVLLTTWTPTIFLPHQRTFRGFTVEGLWYFWKFGCWRQIFAPKHLEWTLQYLSWEWDELTDIFQSGGKRAGPRHLLYREQREQHLGQWTYPLPPEQRCMKTYEPDKMYRDQAGVEAFRRRYSSPATRVIINVTPIPTCAPLYDLYQKTLDGLHDNALERYPIQDFNEGDVHLSPAGTERYSEEAAQQILNGLHASAR